MSLFRRNPVSADDGKARDAAAHAKAHATGEDAVRLREQLAILRETTSQQRERAALERQIEMDRRAGLLARREASQLRSETRLKRKLQALKQRFGDLGLSHSGELVLSPEVRTALSQAAGSYRTARGLPASRPIEPPPNGRGPTLHDPCDVDHETRAAELRRRENELNLRTAMVAAEAARLQEWASDLDREAAALAVQAASAAAGKPSPVPVGAVSRPLPSIPHPPVPARPLPAPAVSASRPAATVSARPVPAAPLPAGFAFRPAAPATEPPADSLQSRIVELEMRIEAATSKEFHRAAAVAEVLAKSLSDLAQVQAALRAGKT